MVIFSSFCVQDFLFWLTALIFRENYYLMKDKCKFLNCFGNKHAVFPFLFCRLAKQKKPVQIWHFSQKRYFWFCQECSECLDQIVHLLFQEMILNCTPAMSYACTKVVKKYCPGFKYEIWNPIHSCKSYPGTWLTTWASRCVFPLEQLRTYIKKWKSPPRAS